MLKELTSFKYNSIPDFSIRIADQNNYSRAYTWNMASDRFIAMPMVCPEGVYLCILTESSWGNLQKEFLHASSHSVTQLQHLICSYAGTVGYDAEKQSAIFGKALLEMTGCAAVELHVYQICNEAFALRPATMDSKTSPTSEKG